jgi:hypothetical protein
MKDNTFAGEAPRVRVSPIRQHLYVKMSSNGSIRHERYWIEADAGWIIVNRFAKEKKSSLTLTAAKRNLCEEEIYQIAEARGHGVSILLLE